MTRKCSGETVQLVFSLSLLLNLNSVLCPVKRICAKNSKWLYIPVYTPLPQSDFYPCVCFYRFCENIGNELSSTFLWTYSTYARHPDRYQNCHSIRLHTHTIRTTPTGVRVLHKTTNAGIAAGFLCQNTDIFFGYNPVSYTHLTLPTSCCV